MTKNKTEQKIGNNSSYNKQVSIETINIYSSEIQKEIIYKDTFDNFKEMKDYVLPLKRK